jgi:ABC-type lipoprotein export system ATPase subunit
LNNGFGSDFESYARLLLERAVAGEISAVGVTDYFTIEGYKGLRQLLADEARLTALIGEETAAAAARILLVPNIEFRARDIITSSHGDARVNFHVLFSDELSPEDIEEHFLREIKFTHESEPDSADQRRSLTVTNLEALGKRLKEEHEPFRSDSDLVVGMRTAVVDHEEVTRVLDQQRARFEGRYLFCLPADEDLSEVGWDGQGHLVRKLMLQKSHMLFSSNASTRDFGLGKKHDSIEAFRQEFKSLKPCVHGSDAHKPEELFTPAEDRFLWIRADPTFHGLRQLLYEPADRVFIGTEPPALRHVAENATKYLDRVGFARTERATEGEIWFSGDLPLNHGLIAVIGNKGSGKSALADVLGLLGDTHTQAEDFSFLNRERFLEPKKGLGRMFKATCVWRSADAISRVLDEQVDRSLPERVKYIPQNYLEKICTELRESPTTAFDRELEDVIFSHVDPSERLGRASLRDVLAYRTSEKEAAVGQLVQKLSAANRRIASLEAQSTDEHRRGIESRLAQRRGELEAHDAAKPAEVKEPSHDPEEQAAAGAIKQELDTIVAEIQSLDEQIAHATQRLNDVSRRVAAADRLLERLTNLESALRDFQSESTEDAELAGIDLARLVQFQVDREPVLAAKEGASTERDEARKSLDERDSESLAGRRKEASERAEATRLRLDEPNRRYQEYLHQLAIWNERRATIIGDDADDPASVRGLEATLAQLEHLPERIHQEEAARLDLTRDIFGLKQELLREYRELHSPVQKFIDSHEVAQEVQALEFTASIVVDGLVEGLLSMIHQGRKGSFQGEQEGRERLRAVVDESDFSTTDGVEAFLASVGRHLTHDLRDEEARPTHVRDQLRQGATSEGVYDFLYGLSYLRPRFELRWLEKPLDQLSPGERGALLLIFYLLIDKRDMPLVIDQPEENLDNKTVTKLLVPAIKYAKERRQIVIVTHNPNLAVVCDADQVIHAQIDKTDGNRITYTAGGIEDREITQLIVDVLEGTKPAFDLRDAKYEVLERVG